EWDAWYAQRLGAPHYLLASGDARITFDELLGDPITVQTRIEDRAEVTIRGHASWLGLDLRDDARLTGGSLWATGEATDRARLDITEDASWGSIDLRDDASARLVGSGGPSTGFSIRLHDRANAKIERAKAGMYQHWGSGLLEVVDTVAPAELGGQRELRIWMRSADARVSLRNFGHQHSLNLPVCGMPCNPWFVIFGEGEYVRAEDSVFHMEIDRTRFVELEDSVGLSVYPVRTGGGGYKDPVRGECIRSVASATNVGFEGHCARLRVSVLGSDGAMLPGATVTLLDGVSGEPSPAYDAGSGEVDARRTTDAAGVATFDLARRAHPLKVRVQGPGIDHTTDVFVVATDAHDLTVRLPR
ncbi:MAG TPA: hypothetical protein VM638_05045, partial [Actinomycetota bacterium]|nr:hypothetical protein [Actinomycetota bacterium]